MNYQIPAMLESGGGSIVNLSSIYGYKPGDLGNAPYLDAEPELMTTVISNHSANECRLNS